MKPSPKKPQPRQLDPNTVVLIKHIVMGVLVIGFVTMILMGIWYGSRIEALTIKEVEVSGGETIDHALVRQAVEVELEGEYAGFVPRRFAWLYPQTKIYEAVSTIDRVHNVDVVRQGGTRLLVTFDEYIPRALWCESVDSDNCLFLDAEGYAFAKAPRLTGGSLLRFVEVGQLPELHTHITEAVLIDAANELVQMLEAQGWFVSHVEVGQEGDVFLRLVEGGELKVNLTQRPFDTVDNLLVILGSEEFSHLAPGNFQYIDLRFGKKVFVNEELAAPEVETASSTASSSESQGSFEAGQLE